MNYNLFLILILPLLSCNLSSNKLNQFDNETNSTSHEFEIKPLDTTKYKNWIKRELKDVGFIYSPKNYTFYDEDNYDSVSKSLQSNASSKGIVLEMKTDTSFVKIGITTKIGQQGTVNSLSNTPYTYQPVTIEDYETILKPQMIEQNEAAGIKILSSTPVSGITINGIYCIGFSIQAISQMYNDTIHSSFYWINNNDRIHQLSYTFTSNLSNKEKLALNKIIESFRITKVY